MPEYRFFLVAQNGHIHEPPIGVEASGDAQALKLAREKLRAKGIEACDIEVWQGTRLVAYLTPAQISPLSRTGPEPDQSREA
ncbi:MAG: hypothetical protein JWO45_1260 [Spartobacteria bacterium]|nr:hypothetical protein [Spartobacteria bacterium]